MQKFSTKQILAILALLSLAGAYLYGFSQRGHDELAELAKHYGQDAVIEKSSTKPLLFTVTTGTGRFYVPVESAYGYGGPTVVATEIDEKGQLGRVMVLDHKETPSYFVRVSKSGFFEQFNKKDVGDSFLLSEDIDAVSGATVSSRAFSEAVRVGSHRVGRDLLNREIVEPERQWQPGRDSMILIALYALVLIGVYFKQPRVRYLTLAGGLIFLGFYANSAISLSNFSAIMLGYLPSIAEKTFWWLLVVGTLLFTLVMGRNLYCSWLCPFGAIQELTAKISGINLRLDRRVIRYARYISYVLTWAALMIVFLTSNPALGTYEPFATLFGHEGIGVQWFILPIVILGSFVLKRFWCRFFCPVGLVLNLSCRLNRKSRNMIGLKYEKQ